jgi:hypothetical protein
MIIPNYIIKKDAIYHSIDVEHYIEILDGRYIGLQFNIEKFEIVNNIENKLLKFEYNLLVIPEQVTFNTQMQITPEEKLYLDQVIGHIIQDIIERGYYEFDTK